MTIPLLVALIRESALLPPLLLLRKTKKANRRWVQALMFSSSSKALKMR
jgi:hypothetical protein